MTLLEEIQLKCDAALIASRDHQAIADQVNATRPPVLGNVSRQYFAMWAASCGMRSKIEDHALNTASPLRDVALACRDVIQGAADNIDFALAPNVQMLGAWVASGELSEANRDALLALATWPAEKATERDVMLSLHDDAGNWLGD